MIVRFLFFIGRIFDFIGGQIFWIAAIFAKNEYKELKRYVILTSDGDEYLVLHHCPEKLHSEIQDGKIHDLTIDLSKKQYKIYNWNNYFDLKRKK